MDMRQSPRSSFRYKKEKESSGLINTNKRKIFDLRKNNRDREEPRGSPPPTPPYIRVTYTAVRWIKCFPSTYQARQPEGAEVAPRQ